MSAREFVLPEERHARRSRQRRPDARLLLIDERHRVSHRQVSDLAELLFPGDLVVVNDAATLPASLDGVHEPTGRPIEARLLSQLAQDGSSDPRRWLAVFYGEGSWREKTELRSAPPRLEPGDGLRFGRGGMAGESPALRARVVGRAPLSERLVELEFEGVASEVWHRLLLNGRPVQYSYLEEALGPWDQQTLFAGPPVALEPPSAAFQLSWALVDRLRSRGVELVAVTHAAGISSTGIPEVDRALPMPERYWIPARSAERIEAARRAGRRVLAIGSSAARAVESAAASGAGRVAPGSAITSLLLGAERPPRVVDGILTGMHEPGSSHLRLLSAFAPAETILKAYSQALGQGYLWHEYGDVSLVLRRGAVF